jgi:LysM repeat protein
LYRAERVLSIPPMRKLITSLSVASVLVFAGCGEERQSMKVTQDKQGHAYVLEGSGGGGSKLGNIRVADAGEIYYTTGPKDTLTLVAKKFNTTVEWLVKRNDLADKEKLKNGIPPGTNLIVPDPAVRR